jgi:hypothetical protein
MISAAPKFIREGVILQEAELVKIDYKKAIFRMVMQTADEKNQNRRIYPKSVLYEAMKNCDERINRRAFLGELDHPVVSGNDAHDGVRQTTVMLRESSHLLRSYEWSGTTLKGELETVDTVNGRQLLGLLKDKCGIGLSMRGMAELDKRGDVNYVKAPLYIITYDAVCTPSHKPAIVDFEQLRFESRDLLTESCNGGVICTPDGVCYLAEYFSRLVDEKIITFCDRWI